MDVAITAALIGAVGSIVATVLGVLLTHRLARQPAKPERPPSQQDGGAVEGMAVGGRVPATRVVPRLGIVPLICVALGSFLAITGTALFGYAVLAFILAVFEALQSGEGPPDLSGVPLGTFVPLGIGLVFAGSVVLWFGMLVAGVRTFGKRAA
jgi:hypothetical protein